MTAPGFRTLPASTGSVVQCDCGWYAPVWGFDPAALHGEHVRAEHPTDLPIHRTQATFGVTCSTCDGGGCYDCTDPA